MTVVVVLAERARLRKLRERLEGLGPVIARAVAIGTGEAPMDMVERLDPAAARRRRQRSMARWLMPFGLVAGFTFTQITELHTFDAVGSWGEPVIGALLGMGSGWLGSFAAAASVVSDDDDRIRSLRNRLAEGNWLLLVEVADGAEMPWAVLQEAKPQAVVRLSEA
ncbi:MAG: hypothetical protein ACKOPN_13750 [Prochlorococcaceae cyanobacterium]